jgi:hypothetical protein
VHVIQLVEYQPVFHRARYPSQIFIRLIEAITNRGPRRVLPRSPGTGVYWADVPRDDDEGRAVVFVLDRDRLLTGYRLSLVNEVDYIDQQGARV